MPESAPAPARAPQRRDIQGLRAVAVLAVIAGHVVHAPQGGFVGVDIFFVISGFLITGLLLREVDRTGTISFRRFYERRAKRILPAAVVVIAATIAGAFVLLGPSSGRDVALDGLASAVFAGNWRFALEGVDYFAQGTPPSPLQHFWSLGVEEQFYLVWPWLMLAIVVFAARRTSWSSARVRRLTRTVIALLTLASLAWAFVETRTNPTFAYFSTFSRAWELGIGALLAFLPAIPLAAAWRRVLAWAGLAGIAASLLVVSESSPLWPAPLALLPVLSTALVIVAGAAPGARGPWLLTNPVATYIGDISYSLYLWHFPVAILLVALVPEGTPAYLAIALAATAALSALSYHLIENPARRATWFRWREGRIRGVTRAWAPTLAALAIVAVAGTAGFAGVSQVRAGGGEVEAQTIAPTPGGSDEIDCRGAGSALHPEACADADFDALAPSPDELLSDTGNAYSCYMGENVALDSCTYGSEDDGALRVALVGDSHAASLLPALEPQLGALGWSLDTFVGRGCGLMEDPGTPTDCDAARPDINERLFSGDYDLVIATSTRLWATPEEAHEAAIERVREAGTHVVVVRDNPLPSEDAIACTTRVGVSPNSDCGTDADVALEKTHTLADAAEAVGAPVVDLTDLYCRDGFCDGIIGGVLVYRDAAGHITRSWATTLSHTLATEIRDAADAG
ncbi:MAG TPA: acyltransferase family protein [Microbacterium sp.]|nr:acyltransferase family protein [Microbacterium sp.]